MTGYLFVSFIDFFVSLYVLTRSRSKLALCFALLWTSFAIWNFNLYLATSVKDLDVLTPLFHGLRFGMFFIAPAMLLFFVTITRTPFTWFWKSAVIVSSLTSTGIYVLNLAYFPSQLVIGQFGYHSAPDTISTIHEINFVVSSLLSVGLTGLRYHKAIYREKARLRWLLASVIIGTTLGILSFNHSKLFGMAGNLIGLFMMAYATTRYHLSGVSEAIRSGLISCLALVPVILTLATLSFFADIYQLTPTETIIPSMILVAFAMIIHNHLQSFITTKIHRVWPSRAYDLEFAKQAAMKLFAAANSLAEIERHFTDIFNRFIPVRTFYIFMTKTEHNASKLEPVLPVGDDDCFPDSKTLSSLISAISPTDKPVLYDDPEANVSALFNVANVSACVPISLSGSVTGYVFLGQPLSKGEFTDTDIRFLNWIGQEIGKPLHNLLELDELEQSLLEAEKTLSIVGHLNIYNHDVKTPFSNIEALVLAGDAFSEDERRRQILKQVNRGKTLVATMTRMLNAQHHNDQSLVDLNSLITDIVDTFAAQKGQFHLALGKTPLVSGVEEELGILFLNLITNALEARQAENHAVTITTSTSVNGQAICEIQDNGIGIPETDLPKVWMPGQSSKRAMGGSGLGLSIAKRIVEQQGGTITLESGKGQGTRIKIAFLPAHQNNPRRRSSHRQQ